LRYFCVMIDHERYMRRCLQLAALGANSVAPNPMVGAVLVYRDTIIGEGYHRIYGEAHAEVNCIRDFEDRFSTGEWMGFGFEDAQALLEQSTIYVSLEPCAHFGKTPPCADMIIARRIGKVVVGIRDPFKEVDGKGIEKLRHAGIEVISPVLEKECREINRRFFTFHTLHRPYVILKWAQSADGMIGMEGERTPISNAWSKLLVHRWRSEEAAILVGTQTALIDDPALTNRYWPGKNPLRVVLDAGLRLPPNLQLFDGTVPTIVFNTVLQEQRQGLHYQRLENWDHPLPEVLSALYHQHIQSVLVEGGVRLLRSFLDLGLWDEVRVINSRSVYLPGGIGAPVIPKARIEQSFELQDDHVSIYSSFAR